MNGSTGDILDFKITTMGVRVLVALIIYEICMLNSRSISAWPLVAEVSRLTTGAERQGDLLDSRSLTVIRSSIPSAAGSKESFTSSKESHQGKLKNNDLGTSFSTRDQGVHDGKHFYNKMLENQRNNDDWSELILTLQWPQTFCMDYNDSHTGQDVCVIPSFVSDWTIHGLWPSNPGSIGPSFCNNTWKFDVSKIEDLVAEMNVTWPNLLIAEKYDSLWSHEWEKHGTCASSLPALYGEHNFFKTTLGLRKRYDVSSILAQGGISPSKDHSYSYEQILDTVRSGVGTNATIECLYDQVTQTVYLSEIEFCLDKQFNLIDCIAPGNKKTRSLGEENCSSDKGIIFPPMH